MINLVRAEFRKTFSTQVWFWMLVVCLALTTLGVVVPLATSGDADVSLHLHDLFSIVAEVPAYVALFVLGVLSVTTEYRYQTITPTVLGTPSRATIMTAKLIATSLVAVGYALACLVLELAIALPWLSSRGIDAHLGNEVGALLGVFVVLVLYAVVGLGFGALVRNQIVAISVGIAFVLIIDHIIGAIPGVKDIYPYLLSGATNAITNSKADRTFNGVTLLSPLAGVAVLVAWGLVTAVVGATVSMNRDIT